MNDKDRDKLFKALNKNLDTVIKNQNVLIKNDAIYNDWIKYFDGKNKAQDTFDKSVVQSLKAQDSKIGTVLELQAQIKEITNVVSELKKGFEVKP